MRALPGVLAGLIGVAACQLARTAPPDGFTRSSAARQRALEERFLGAPDPSRIRVAHRELTRSPHPAGSSRNRELADWIARQFTEAGMEDVQMVRHDVFLPATLEARVELVAPRVWQVPLREDPEPADPGMALAVATLPPAAHAFSASGDLQAQLVYAGSGMPEHYDWLERHGIDVRGRIVLVRSSSPRTYRGFLAHTAERRGAAGILMFPDDPSGDAAAPPQQPDEPRPSRIERGSIVYDAAAPGDPLTPGWPSIAGARRLDPAAATSLPKIVSVPISPASARELLQSIGGPASPAWWRGHAAQRVGPGPATVRMRVRTDDRIRAIWTVTGQFRGTSPDVVIAGNHRDAWVYGGADPSSGSAALVELARTLGTLIRHGWRPRRSILLASWDAEEHGLMSSTEWAEQHAPWLTARAVAYLNVDSGVSGRRFTAAGNAALGQLLTGVAERVRDPSTGVPIATIARDASRGAQGIPTVMDDRLGGGSDYVVFANHLGIPVADLAFDGAYPVYHTAYDTHQWIAEDADPGFLYHAALVKVWGLAALRLAQADALPIDPIAAARQISGSVRASESDWARVADARTTDGLRRSVDDLAAAAAAYGARRMRALAGQDDEALADVNRRALLFERAFIDAEGLPGRPWFRHVIHAPRFSYEPEAMPGLAAAVRSSDRGLFEREAMRVTAALRRATAVLGR